MKTGKITAKLRDADPVCLMVNGGEVKRYKNIDLPDMLKEVEMPSFSAVVLSFPTIFASYSFFHKTFYFIPAFMIGKAFSFGLLYVKRKSIRGLSALKTSFGGKNQNIL